MPIREISNGVLLSTSVTMLAVRYLVRDREQQKRRIIQVLYGFALSGLLSCWLQPWRGDGANPFHIMVFLGLGLFALMLIDDIVDWYRERRRGRSAERGSV